MPGVTVVRCFAWDSDGQTNTCKFAVTVVDVSQPLLESPETVVVPTDAGSCSASRVTLGFPQARYFDGPVSLTNDAPDEFFKGTNFITWEAADPPGNRATCQQMVVVRDEQPPVMALPPVVMMTAPAGLSHVRRIMLEAPQITDNCGNARCTNDAASELSIGTNAIRWTAIDDDGNAVSAEQRVVVLDSQPPTIECPPDLAVTVEPGQPFATNVVLGAPVASDNHHISAVTSDATALYGPGRDWWWVDPVNGDDAEVRQGDVGRAFRTLGAALTAASDGDTIVMMPGTNLIRCAFLGDETPELLITRSNLSIYGQPGATLLATNFGDGVLCVGAGNLRIEGLTFIGFRTNDAAAPFRLWAAIHVMGGCEGAEIAGNRLDNWMNQGIAVLNRDPSTSTNVWVHDNFITRCGFAWRTTNGLPFNRFDGAAIVPDAGWLVERNRIEDCAITIEVYPPNNLGCRPQPCVVRNNVLRNNLTGICGGNDLCPVIITGNTIVNDTNYTWVVDTSFNPWIGLGNLEGWFPFGVAFQGTYNGPVVSSNTIAGWRVGIGATDGALTNLSLSGNFITQTRQVGIFIGNGGVSPASSRNIAIRGNIITNAQSWPGFGAITVESAADLEIVGNGLSGHFWDGIGIYGTMVKSSNVLVRDNRLEGSFNWGVFVSDGTCTATIRDNATEAASFVWGKYGTGSPEVAVIDGNPSVSPPIPPPSMDWETSWVFPSWEEQMYGDALARFPLGTNFVRWTAVDASGNTSTCSQQIIVQSADPSPEPCPDDLTIEVSSNCTAVANYRPPNAGSNSVVTCHPPPGSVLPVGSTTVRCWTADGTGRTNECAFGITVIDTPPTISLHRVVGQNNFTLSWPETCAEWMLEFSSLAGGVGEWTLVAADSETVDGFHRVIVPAVGESRFFRLRRP